MSLAYHLQLIPNMEKRLEINAFLKDSYWARDVWVYGDEVFENRGRKFLHPGAKLVFTDFKPSLRDELKYFFATKLVTKGIKASTIFADYQYCMKHFCNFINAYYPQLNSFSELNFESAVALWRSYILSLGLIYDTRTPYRAQLYQPYIFFKEFYDTRNEYEKDIWDCRKIAGANYRLNTANYRINFTFVPAVFRKFVQRYVKLRLTIRSVSQCRTELLSLSRFLSDIHQLEPKWKNLNELTRCHMERYLISYLNSVNTWKRPNVDHLCAIKSFLEYMQRLDYPEAPAISSASLIFDEDIPSCPRISHLSERVKYIPEGVIMQLEENLEHLTPKEYIPVVLLLLATGWRISDILNLRYDKCLEHTPQGWYLCGDIQKTNIIDHRVPITDEVYAAIKANVDFAVSKSTEENNPRHLLFNRYFGKRMGNCPDNTRISEALNKLAVKRNITDDQGNIYYFRCHAFRHTKGVELINNGMNLIHVQKWMAHMSPEMTLVYARILDTTLRKSWEEATRKGLFRISESGKVRKIDISEIQNEDLIEWEYIRHNLDAVRMPLGFCMKPKKQECHSQLNPCLTCRNLCTTPDFIPQYEMEMRETRALIEKGREQGRDVWVEKNMCLLSRYEEIISVLKSGKTHHIAGKRGREYVGKEREDAKQ